MRILLLLTAIILILAMIAYFMGKSDFVVGDKTLTFEEKVSVLHHPEGRYTIQFSVPGDYKIYQGLSPKSID